MMMAAVLISPIFFGSPYTYAYSFAFLCILFGGLLMLRENVVREVGHLYFRWPATGMDPLFISFLFLLITQMIPLPVSFLTWLSPDSKVAGDMSQPAVVALDPEALKSHWHTLAPYIYPVRMSLVRWIVYGLLFFGLTQTLNSRRRIEMAVISILILCCFEALYGIIQTYSGSGKVLWFKYTHDGKSVSGTYLNRNHFAGLMEMGIILAVSYAGALSEKSAGAHSMQGREKTLRKRILQYLSKSKKLNKRFMVLFSGIVMGIGLILSASRGGIISAAGALLIMGFLFSIKQDYRRKRLIIFLFSLLTAAYVLYIGIDYTIGRFYAFDMDFKTRMGYASQALTVFSDYRLAGVGVGNYKYVTPRYGNPIDFAHDDWVQFMAETGTVGLTLLLLGIAWYVFTVLKKWFSCSNPFSVCLGIAPIAAMTSIGIHSFSDFNLHMPANFMMLSAITAIGYSALHFEKRHQHEKMSYHFRSWPLRGSGVMILALFSITILWAGVWIIRHFIADAYCNTVPNMTMQLDQHPPQNETLTAISWDPDNAEYRFKLGMELMETRSREMQSSKKDMVWWHEQRAPIIAAFEDAIRLNPLRDYYHMRLGWEYSYQFNLPDYMEVWLPAADISMDRAAHFTGIGPGYRDMHLDLGNYWTMRSKTLDPSDMQHGIAWIKAVWHYKKAMELEKGKQVTDKITTYVKDFYPEEDRLKEILE